MNESQGGDVQIAIQPEVFIFPSLPGEVDENQSLEGETEVAERCLALDFRQMR
jgi:hypothetical protein